MISLRQLRRRAKDTIFRLLGVYNHLSSEEYISELESRGCEIGSGTKFFGENNVDLNRANNITIGKNCIITDRVRILAHTHDQPILERAFDNAPEYNNAGFVKIGDNVFIGEKTIILPDVSIGENVIIGAGSVVTSDIPPNTVAAGNPCEVIYSLKEYQNRRTKK